MYAPASTWNLAVVFFISVGSVLAILGSCKLIQVVQKWWKDFKEKRLLKQQQKLGGKVSMDEEKISFNVFL